MNYSACVRNGKTAVTVKYLTDTADSFGDLADMVNREGESTGIESLIEYHFSRGYAEVQSVTMTRRQSFTVNRRIPARIETSCRACGKAS